MGHLTASGRTRVSEFGKKRRNFDGSMMVVLKYLEGLFGRGIGLFCDTPEWIPAILLGKPV